MDGWKMSFLLGRPIFRFHVKRREGSRLKKHLVIPSKRLGIDPISKQSEKIQKKSFFYWQHGFLPPRFSWTNDEKKTNLIDSCIEPGIFLSVWPFHDEETLEISKKQPGSHEI